MEPALVAIITLLFAALNMLAVFLGAFKVPQDAYFIGITHWYEDFFFYLSHLSQGASGLWQTRNWYTTETLPPNPGWWTNILLGKVGGTLSFDPWVTYRSALFILSVVLILTIYFVCKKLFPHNRTLRIMSFILSLTATSFFQISQTSQGITIIPYTFFFSTMLSFNRFGGTVHQMMANILSLLLILLVATSVQKIQNKERIPGVFWVILPLISFLLTMLQPMAGVMIAGSTGIVLLSVLIRHWGKSLFFRSFILEAALLLPVIPVCLSFLNLSRHPFYTMTLKTFEGTIPPATPITLLLSLGVIIFFLPFGILPSIRKKSPLFDIGLVYAFLPILLYLSPIPRLIGIQYSRILQPESHVFLAALAVMGMGTIAHLISRKIPVKKQLVFTILFSFILLAMTPTLIYEVKGKIQAGNDFTYLNSIPKPLYLGLTFLKERPFGNVFAPYLQSQFVPVVSEKPVYAAHRTMTIDYEKKMKDVEAFFTLQWDAVKARQFFREKQIRYIILPAGIESQKNVASLYPFLSPIWSTETLGIFEVRAP